MNRQIRFKDWQFDPNSGELVRIVDESEVVSERLPPKPSRLLAFLIERAPDIVSADEIRELLWPDVQIEYEQSLHFCIRQIRAAIGDSATEPQYVETVPRRGYRFIASVDSLPASEKEKELDAADSGRGSRAAASASQGAVVSGGTSRPSWVVGVLLLLAVLAMIYAGSQYLRDDNLDRQVDPLAAVASAPVRLAIMTFEDVDPETGRLIENGIAEALLRQLADPIRGQAEVIGPTTTEAYEGNAEKLRQLIQDYKLDYVLNGRMIRREERTVLLAELIRAEDGAHVWVQDFPDFPDGTKIVTEILEGVVGYIEQTHDPASRPEGMR